jgi:TolA-binding protein
MALLHHTASLKFFDSRYEKEVTMKAMLDSPAPSTPTDFRAKAREVRWRYAVALVEAGKLNTATAALLDFIKDHPSTAEATKATEYLAAIADEHAANGRMRLATELYEKLSEVA